MSSFESGNGGVYADIREAKSALPPMEERDWLTIEEVFPNFHLRDRLGLARA